ncbi:hypothetical protein HPB49_002299 [Dermacentor silvarum]|uniref:Uncharacterized protein n=1 Tax=Dermacentor silvarum TaxID=543639 RepID=A0ACB8DA39_DERSI|nr:hypothetical protein HPB49_002299 [Dermacentor silvarum]
MTATARRKEFCPSYFAELVGPTRARYEAKINMCDGVDPYTSCGGTDTTTDVDLLPVTTHADIVNYLVLSTNHVSPTEMKSYKSLEAHNYTSQVAGSEEERRQRSAKNAAASDRAATEEEERPRQNPFGEPLPRVGPSPPPANRFATGAAGAAFYGRTLQYKAPLLWVPAPGAAAPVCVMREPNAFTSQTPTPEISFSAEKRCGKVVQTVPARLPAAASNEPRSRVNKAGICNADPANLPAVYEPELRKRKN